MGVVSSSDSPLSELANACHMSLSSQCAEAAARGDFRSPSDCEQALGLVAAMEAVPRMAASSQQQHAPAVQVGGGLSGWRSHHTIILLLLMNAAALVGATAAFWAVRRAQRRTPFGDGLPQVAYVLPSKV